jgi:hypothetical protein
MTFHGAIFGLRGHEDRRHNLTLTMAAGKYDYAKCSGMRHDHSHPMQVLMPYFEL